MSPTSFAASKIWGSVTIGAVAAMVAFLVPSQVVILLIMELVALLSINSVSYQRDYVRQPITQAEIDFSVANERRQIVSELIEHIEGASHSRRACGIDCPVPNLLAKLKMDVMGSL